MEEVTNVEETEQSTKVQELELGPEGSIEEEEGDSSLPSDEVEFTMPEKFAGKTAEEIAKSYLELEKFKGTNGEEVETPAEKPEDAPQGNKYLDEYLESGELSEESYVELEKEGITRADAKDRLEYEKYKNQKAVDSLVEVIGGIDNFTAMDEWAKGAFTQDELVNYTTELTGATEYGKKAILKDLYSQYKKANAGEDVEVDVIHTNQTQTTAARGYTSQHELQADMSDRRYGTDRSYTEAVEKKLARSKNFS